MNNPDLRREDRELISGHVFESKQFSEAYQARTTDLDLQSLLRRQPQDEERRNRARVCPLSFGFLSCSMTD